MGIYVRYIDAAAVLPGRVEDEDMEVEATYFASNVGYGEVARGSAELLTPGVAPFTDIGRENITLFFVRRDIGKVFIIECESAEENTGGVIVANLFAVFVLRAKVVCNGTKSLTVKTIVPGARALLTARKAVATRDKDFVIGVSLGHTNILGTAQGAVPRINNLDGLVASVPICWLGLHPRRGGRVRTSTQQGALR